VRPIEAPTAPWRCGTTSYILPDDILPNAQYLAPLIDDIELVLFESDQLSNLPSLGTIEKLGRIAKLHDLSYTIHFPLDVFPGSLEESVRRASVARYRHIRSLVSPLDPFAYILHLTPQSYGSCPATDVAAWHCQLDRTLAEMLDDGWESKMLCVETLSYPFHFVMDLVEKYDLAVTLDIGHVWLAGYDAHRIARELLPLARVIHLHGVAGDHDHLGLGSTPKDLRDDFLSALMRQIESDGQRRVLTLEVFDQPAFKESLRVVDEFLRVDSSSCGIGGNCDGFV
jgi:sugar phosphate isomerase/epimerase